MRHASARRNQTELAQTELHCSLIRVEPRPRLHRQIRVSSAQMQLVIAVLGLVRRVGQAVLVPQLCLDLLINLCGRQLF